MFIVFKTITFFDDSALSQMNVTPLKFAFFTNY